MPVKKPATRASSSRSKSKVKQSSSGLFSNGLNFKILLVFIVLFGAVGGFVIYMSRAETADQLLLSKEFVRPMTVTRDANDPESKTAKQNYQDLSFQVYNSGEVICGDPADPNTVTTTTLNSGQLKALQKQVNATGINSTPNGPVANDGEIILGDNITTITYLNNGETKTLIATADKPQSAVINQITAIAESTCKKAVTKINRANAKQPSINKIDKNKGNDATENKLTSYIKQQFTPKAEAAVNNASTATYDQIARINYTRLLNGRPALQQNLCLSIAAFNWSYVMDYYQRLVHNSPLQTSQGAGCGYWYSLGENIGWMGCSNTRTEVDCSKTLFNGFMGSTAHRNNILSITAPFNTVGVGSIRDTGRQQLWITHKFAQY